MWATQYRARLEARERHMLVTRTAPTLNATAQPDALSTSAIMLAADPRIEGGGLLGFAQNVNEREEGEEERVEAIEDVVEANEDVVEACSTPDGAPGGSAFTISGLRSRPSCPHQRAYAVQS